MLIDSAYIRKNINKDRVVNMQLAFRNVNLLNPLYEQMLNGKITKIEITKGIMYNTKCFREVIKFSLYNTKIIISAGIKRITISIKEVYVKKHLILLYFLLFWLLE